MIITPLIDDIDKGTELNYYGIPLQVVRGGIKNIAYQEKLRKLNELVPEGQDPDENLIARAMAGTVLIGWPTFVLNGEDVVYSEENAESLLVDDYDCADKVFIYANTIENYIDSKKEALLKKS